jgi:uncharacterized protein YggE
MPSRRSRNLDRHWSPDCHCRVGRDGGGYQASNTVNVKIHHLANVPGVIAAAQKAVGDDIQLNGINLTLSDNTTQLQGARQAAMSTAAARAKVWAQLAGRHLGKVLVAEVARRLKPDR